MLKIAICDDEKYYRTEIRKLIGGCLETRQLMEVTVAAKREKGRWKIHVSEPFINAFMGNFNTEHCSKDVEDRLNSLEDSYEDKMDQWGENFEAKMEGWLERIFGE